MQHINARHAGFTLLELIVAIAVFSMLAVMAYGGLGSIIDNRTRTDAVLTRLSQLQKAMTTINRDIEQIMQRGIRDELGDTQGYLMSSTADSNLIEFTRGGWRNPALLTRSTLQRVAYSMDEDKLVREQWRLVDKVEGVESTTTTLLEEIQHVEFRFLDNKQKWHKSWPPQNADPDQGLPGPIAVEVTLELKDWGEIVRLFRLAGGLLG